MSFFRAFNEKTIRGQLSPASSAALQKVSLLQQTPSTNALLLQLPAEQRHAHVVLADHQTAGKGRRGRSWQSPPGSNIYLSLGWNFAKEPFDLSCLPLAIGVAAVRGLQQVGVSGLGLKWPNDIQADRKKLGGILLESKPLVGGGVSVVVGVGINVSMSPQSLAAQSIDQPWTTVSAVLGNSPDVGLRDRIAGIVLDQLLGCVVAYTETGFQSFADHWLQLDVIKNRPVTVKLAGKAIHGQARGIDQQGNLLVAEHSAGDHIQLHRFSSGEVSVRLGNFNE